MKKLLALMTAVLMIVSVFAATVSAEDTVPAPIAVYNFEDGKDIGKDISGNGNSLLTKGDVDTVDGKHGKAVRFDYEGALVAATGNNGADFIDNIELSGSKEMTLMYWIKYDVSDFAEWDSANDWRRAVSNGTDGGAGYGGFAMLSLLDNIIVPGAINPACVFHTEALGTSSSGNWSTYEYTTDWAHVAWTVNQNTGNCKFYVNGTCIFDLGDQNLANALANTQRAFALGCNYIVDADGNEQFNQSYAGSMDEFYAFDKALDADQIAYYMNNNYKAPVVTDAPTAEGTDSNKPSTDTSDIFAAVIPAAVISCAVILVASKKRQTK